MGSAFHQLYPRYNGTLTPTAPTAIRQWETFTFYTDQTLECLVYLFIYSVLLGNTHLTYANSVDPDQTPHPATSDLSMHCLPLMVTFFEGLFLPIEAS